MNCREKKKKGLQEEEEERTHTPPPLGFEISSFCCQYWTVGFSLCRFREMNGRSWLKEMLFGWSYWKHIFSYQIENLFVYFLDISIYVDPYDPVGFLDNRPNLFSSNLVFLFLLQVQKKLSRDVRNSYNYAK